MSAAGCNIGKTVDRGTIKYVSPGIIAASEVPEACAVGSAISPLLLALGHHKAEKRRPHKAAVLTLLASGMCAEQALHEGELKELQASFLLSQGIPASVAGPLMKDALLLQRRLHAEAARLDQAAFLSLIDAFGAPTSVRDCPAGLKAREELLYLLGLTAGLLAVIHDVHAERAVGVSGDVPLRVARGAGCLADEKWWGLPKALRAAVWASVPGSAPEGVDPWRELADAADAGEAQGVWLGRALQVQVALDAGREELHVAAIVAHGRARARTPGRAEVGLLNDYAMRMVRHFSDRLWVSKTGHRTAGTVGTLPGATAESGERTPTASDLELLDAVVGEPPAGRLGPAP